MIADEITHQIESFIGFEPTADQHRAACACADFLLDNDARTLFLLKGSAGTGKTSFAAALVKALSAFKQKVLLMAPTGRAAKVFATNSGHAAFTIHRKIYRQKSFAGLDTAFLLNDNLHKDTLFIVDEASMIANQGFGKGTFGSGRLLDDLISFVYNGNNCRLLLLGDSAQLPPVGEETSPALDMLNLESYRLRVREVTLNEVLRQSQTSGILHNATRIREMILQDTVGVPPAIRLRSFADITVVTGEELIEALQSSYRDVGIDETMVVTRSNARAKAYNMGIRARVLDREDELCAGDMLLVAKNNYYWTERAKAPLAFIANGDRAVVRRVRNLRTLYDLRFADVLLQFPDYQQYELTATVALDALQADAPALTKEQNEQLYRGVCDDYADLPLKPERMKCIRADAHFNALQIKYAYAGTCHKAQGGQWAHVFVDQGYITDDMLTPDYYRWLYTAFTRASQRLFLVNWKANQTET